MKIAGNTAAEIFDSIRTSAQTGGLAPGQGLPPVRDLAVALGVNRNTVAMAYKRLVAAGIADTRGRLGTVIREQPGLLAQEGSMPDSPLADLSGGNPNPQWLPDMAAALAGQAHRPRLPRLYGEATVDSALEITGRQWMAGQCPADFALDLAHGAVDAVERLLSAHLVAGDKVAVEEPCFLSHLNVLRIHGFQPLGVAVDAEGMQPRALEQALAQGAQAVILTPRAHNPTGASLSAARARRLRALLARHPQVLVIVDDHFARLAVTDYHDAIPPTARRWALIRSVSKMLGPDLRLAFVASDAQTALRLRLRLAPGMNWVSHLLQDAVRACLASPAIHARIDQAREDYARRRQIMTAALAAQGIRVAAPADGLNLWLPLPGNSQLVVLALAQRGWLVRGGEAFGVHAPAHGLRITVSAIDEASARTFARALGHAIHADGVVPKGGVARRKPIEAPR